MTADREKHAPGAMKKTRMTRAWSLLACGALCLALPVVVPALASAFPAAGANDEEATVTRWRAERVKSLTSDTGWLTLVGLLWLRDGDNSFGRAPTNTLVLDNAALADNAGSFQVQDHHVRFTARPGAGITHHGEPVTRIEMDSDAVGEPTVVSSGSLRFFVIERAGKLGVRVRDLANPRRLDFRGLKYFPISPDWRISARFEPYEPARHINIINILGMEDEALCPGALVFTRNGQESRLDTVLESPTDQRLFVMFQDTTSGRETYGGGRFMYIPMPVEGLATLDFNEAYNPPCALNDFATCPLPPPQNRLRIRVAAGELRYDGGHERPP